MKGFHCNQTLRMYNSGLTVEILMGGSNSVDYIFQLAQLRLQIFTGLISLFPNAHLTFTPQNFLLEKVPNSNVF